MRIVSKKITNNCSGVKNDGGKFVIPCVLVVEGVLNGELLSIDHIAKSLDSWNGKPVVISHPSDTNGEYMSAINPEVYQKQLIGFVFGARIDGDKLCGELHLDEKMICACGHCELSERLKRCEMIEVSTGYMRDKMEGAGVFNGVEYSGIQQNIEPDHLAVLVDEIGACSLADGCGTNRANKARKQNKQTKKGKTMKKKELEVYAKALVANEKLTPEQFDVIMAMDEEQAAIAATLMQASADAAKAAMPKVEEPKTEDAPIEAMSEDKIEEIVANRLEDALDRREAMRTIAANSEMTAEELKPLSTASLKKMCANMVSADFSGMSGFSQSAEKDVVVNSKTAPVSMGIVRRV
jgi:hypothetical protein